MDRFESILGGAFGIFCMAGAFLADGGKWDLYSRSRTEPLARFSRGILFIVGLFMVLIALFRTV